MFQQIRVAQRKRGGPITHRSQDRNLALIERRLPISDSYFFSFHFIWLMRRRFNYRHIDSYHRLVGISFGSDGPRYISFRALSKSRDKSIISFIYCEPSAHLSVENNNTQIPNLSLTLSLSILRLTYRNIRTHTHPDGP
ncbi:hypothetical protein Csa_000411 [Cucumis sativus]|uniref:Uncharacterized protein n=1 Tax=Cucumis sativus TaxID=3659 RepID=A0A0A0KJI7_CUCSA|nr:hypothetical protein Csa_000411 [Cucumis sativus]